MGGEPSTADVRHVRLRPLLAILGGVLCVVAFVGASTTATAGRVCSSDTHAGGYSYAGHQAASRGHGVRASITLTRRPIVGAGHVAGWVGVGGRDQGANGGDAWIQAGIASLRGLGTVLYAEITREAKEPELVVVDRDVVVGRPYRIAVLELTGHPGWWRVWVDGEPVTAKVHMPGTSGRWAPIVTAESWNAGTSACNDFAFRFERVLFPPTREGPGARSSPATASSMAGIACATSPARSLRPPARRFAQRPRPARSCRVGGP